MNKYRKKPIVIEAEQWFPGKDIKGVFDARFDDCGHSSIQGPHCHTLEGALHVSPGDWIITGVKGERYPCKPDIFEQTYELVKE